jgi:hypothetical protein
MQLRKRTAGVGGTVSALLTVLLLVIGFTVSTGLLSTIYSAQAEVFRKAINVGEAVSERLQAYVYQDVKTNRTLLTIRNVGSVGSEVEYLMAVGYDGSVLAEARPTETLRLGIQQAITLPLADLLGPGFENYTEVRSRMATLYLKTVKGGVFGSGYMAPPSVMTAAYATSTTTLTTEETSVETLTFSTGTTALTTWTATVVLNNPDHWPVHSYVGVAFMRQQPTNILNGWYPAGYRWPGPTFGPYYNNPPNQFYPQLFRWVTPGKPGFPSWGVHQGFTAKDQNDRIRPVTASNISIPTLVMTKINTYIYNEYPLSDTRCYYPYDGNPAYPEPLGYYGQHYCYVRTDYTGNFPSPPWVYCPRTRLSNGWCDVLVSGTVQWDVGQGSSPIFRFSRFGPVYIGLPDGSEQIEHIVMAPRLALTSTTYYTPRTLTSTSTTTYTTTTRTTTQTITMPWYTWTTTIYYRSTVTSTTTLTSTSFRPVTTSQYTTDIRDTQYAVFPGTIVAKTEVQIPTGTAYYKNYYNLAYIKVVDLWNTTNILAFAGNGETRIDVKVDRPIGVAAVYTYDRTEVYIPPPQPPGPCRAALAAPVCFSDDVSGLEMTSPPYIHVPCEIADRVDIVVEATTTNPDCNAYLVDGSAQGTVSSNNVVRCPKNGNNISCTVPRYYYVVFDCDLNR